MATVGTSEQQLNIQVLEFGSLSWVNIEKPGMAEMQYLKEHHSFHQLLLNDCLSVVQLPKLDEFDDHLFLVLHFPDSTGDHESLSPTKWTSLQGQPMWSPYTGVTCAP